MCVPDGLGHLRALSLPVVRQAPDEVDEVEAAAEDAAHGAEQHQLAVVGGGCAQGALHFLHHLKGTGRHGREGNPQGILLLDHLDPRKVHLQPDTVACIYQVTRKFLIF